jgi:hypothetical protein
MIIQQTAEQIGNWWDAFVSVRASEEDTEIFR